MSDRNKLEEKTEENKKEGKEEKVNGMRCLVNDKKNKKKKVKSNKKKSIKKNNPDLKISFNMNNLKEEEKINLNLDLDSFLFQRKCFC